jgi:Uma2 family endonuclease
LVVFEVLSEETELVDRSDKRREYQAIPSLAHYVLVSQDVLRPEIYSRREGQWLFTELEGSETVVTLDPPGIEFPLGELYVGLDLADADRDELSPTF